MSTKTILLIGGDVSLVRQWKTQFPDTYDVRYALDSGEATRMLGQNVP